MRSIKNALALAAVAVVSSSSPARAQSANPVSDALRSTMQGAEKNFLGSAETMPADKYGFKPTDKNMTFGAHMAHMADFNETMCAMIGGASAPAGAKVSGTSPKTDVVGHLRSSFAFCRTALAGLTDASLGSMVSFYGSQISKGAAVLILSGDWSDHYAVTATYLRLNQLLPPTAKSGM